MLKNQRVFQRGQDRLLHPHARKIDQMQRQMRHNLKEHDAKSRQKAKRSQFSIRAAWFREQIPRVCGLGNAPSAIELKALATLFVRRHDEELNALRARRNPPSGQIKLMERFRQAEMDEFKGPPGMEIPRTGTDEELAALFSWTGDEASVAKLKREHVQAALKDSDEAAAVLQLVKTIQDKLVGAATVAIKRDESRGKVPSPGTVATAALEAKVRAAKRATSGRAADVLAGKKVSAKQALGQVVAGAGTELRKLRQQLDAKKRRHKQLAMSRGLI